MKKKCMQCGGKVKMAKGGSTPKPFAAGIPYAAGAGQTDGKNGKMAKGGKVKKYAKGGTSFGMLSVKAGVDNNPKPTAADRIAGAKMQKGGVTTTVTKPKSTDPYPTAVKGHQMKMDGLALKAKGQLMKASGAAMKAKGAAMKQAGSTQKRAKGGVVSRKK